MATTVTGKRRIEWLAQPKRLHAGFIEDRRSVYWIDSTPLKAGENGQTTFYASPRLHELARHRDPHPRWECDRPTPQWTVSKATMLAQPSERIHFLSEPKSYTLYKYDRSPYTQITLGARTNTATSRLEMLARPRKREDTFAYPEEYWGQSFPVRGEAMHAHPSNLIESLAQAKSCNEEFQYERILPIPVAESALKALASQRIHQLSQPKPRSIAPVDVFDPYQVSDAAQKARATQRIRELSMSLPRKTKEKVKKARAEAKSTKTTDS
ncbi:hypothetical protein CHS0354_017609 [Potamilus streckersoni]|uniref:Testicular haploid expressed gene protein-like n=1 Tax=Potamilus streckersoni TaxID=2493646 RepID=A0AAE0VHD6_9BIVA|nr:hypothetical protein CHS0354_017609 [Potamilus streckersoni]